MEEEKRQANLSLTKMSYAVDEVQKALRPVLSAVDSMRASSNEEELDAMTRARMHISLCYASNSLFCMYLRTQGIDPMSHPVAEELARVQDAFMRMRKVEAGLSAEPQPMPNRDRRRHIMNAKKSAERLSQVVFPEEHDLQLALQGAKKKQDEMKANGENGAGASDDKSVAYEKSDSDVEEAVADNGKSDEVTPKKRKKDKSGRKSSEKKEKKRKKSKKSKTDSEQTNGEERTSEEKRERKRRKREKKKKRNETE